jgi:hypothetical protein
VTDIPFRVEPGATPGTAPLGYEVARDGRVRLTVRAGERRTGGHSIAVTRVSRAGTRLIISCELRAPDPEAIVTQVLTSPAQTVSVDERSVRGAREAVLLDQSGAEVARISA